MPKHVDAARAWLEKRHARAPFRYEDMKCMFCCHGIQKFVLKLAQTLVPEEDWVCVNSTKEDKHTAFGHWNCITEDERGRELVMDYCIRGPESLGVNLTKEIEREIGINHGFAEYALLLTGAKPFPDQVVPLAGNERGKLVRHYERQAVREGMSKSDWHKLVRSYEHNVLLLDKDGLPLCKKERRHINVWGI